MHEAKSRLSQLVAQAQAEGLLLITSDERVALYPGPIRRI